MAETAWEQAWNVFETLNPFHTCSRSVPALFRQRFEVFQVKPLHSFCKQHGLSKTTVYRFLTHHGFDLSEGLSDEAIALAKQQFLGVKPVAPSRVPIDFIQSSELAPVEVRPVVLPDGFDPAAAVRLFDGVMGGATDTDTMIAVATQAIDAIDQAIDAKIESQRRELEKAENAAKALSQKVSEAKTRLQIKALESRMVAAQQTKATEQAEAAFGELMQMGGTPQGGTQ